MEETYLDIVNKYSSCALAIGLILNLPDLVLEAVLGIVTSVSSLNSLSVDSLKKFVYFFVYLFTKLVKLFASLQK